MAQPNRGYIFEAVWAASVAARFYKRIGDIEKIKKAGAFEKSVSNRTIMGNLPLINAKDTQDMIIEIWNSGKRLRRQTQNDVNFKSIVKDYLVVDIGVPAPVDNFISKMVATKNFSEIADFIRVSSAAANGSMQLQSRVKSVAFNGVVDVINVTADGLVDQRTVKADVTVSIQSGDPKARILPFPVSCKVPGGEQFAQISGLEFDKFVSLFNNLGMSIPENIKQEWENSVNEFINSGVFERRYATKEAIKQTKAPEKTKRAASKVYSAMAQKMQSNFPTESFANFIYQGFTSGVDTEVIKLFESSKRGNKIIVGAKTITADQEFKNLLSQQTYRVSHSGSTIKIYADGITGHIMQFRYRWENPSNTTGDTKTYKMYARHYLEAGPGMFKIDPRSQEIRPR
jgi:hypothetical protein